MRELAGDWDGDDARAVFLHVPAAVGQALPVGEQHLDGEPAGDLDAVLPIGREDEVVGLERECRSDLHGFLPLEHGVGPDPTLTLQGEHASVELTGEDHVAIHPLVELGVEPGVLADQSALRVDYLKCRLQF